MTPEAMARSRARLGRDPDEPRYLGDLIRDMGWWDDVSRDPLADLQDYTTPGTGDRLLGTPGVETTEEAMVRAILQRLHPDLEDEQKALQPGDRMDPEPHQVVPWEDPSWDVYMVRGGRGSGKTVTGARAVVEHVREWGDVLGADCRVGVGAPTIGDARDVCAEGPTGLITLWPDEFEWRRSLLEAVHKPTGAIVKFLGSEEPNRWNGPAWSLVWADELALWKEESWEQAQFGVRLGPNPRFVVTTTPKVRKFVWDLGDEEGTRMVHVTTYDNPHLPKRALDRWERRYAGTTLGRQELLGERITEAEGALWKRAWIDEHRIPRLELLPPGLSLTRLCIAVDPAVTAGPKSDETGITVPARGSDGDGYLLADLSGRMPTGTWARKVVAAYYDWEADYVVAETNNGGDLVEDAIRGVDSRVPVHQVKASRGKAVRAQPVASLYQQGRIHHVGQGFPHLEDQMCTWDPNDRHASSPDRMESAVWGFADLLLGGYESWDSRDWRTHRR